jgi:uncharacterized protein (DUF1919 family)
MIFPIVATFDPRGTLFQGTLNMSGSCLAYQDFSGLFVLEKIFNDPILNVYVHFCTYLPFEENLALYLDNFEFPLHKHILHQV